MKSVPRRLALVISALLLLLVVVSMPAPVTAATPAPLDVRVACITAVFIPPLRFMSCNANVSGGVAPYAYTWFVNGAAPPITPIGSVLTAFCLAGSQVDVGVQVTDATGAVGKGRTVFTC